jgi:hypothetical protein
MQGQISFFFSWVKTVITIRKNVIKEARAVRGPYSQGVSKETTKNHGMALSWDLNPYLPNKK